MPTTAPLLAPVKGIKPQILKKICEKRTFSAYYWDGSGPLVICLHGFPDTVNSFHLMVPALVEAGYRVLVPVMPGYEHSSSDPFNRYFVTDLAEDVVAWVDRMGEDAAHLVGHDWGAVTAWLASAMFPHRFFSMTSIAIPPLKRFGEALQRCPSQLLKSWYMGFFQLPLLPERVIKARDGAFVRMLWRRWSPGWPPPEALLQPALDALQDPIICRSALGYYRCLTRVFHPRHEQGRRALKLPYQVPCLMITGADDGCMDTRLFELGMREADFMAGAELYRLMGAGHFCHLEKPRQVHAKLLSFLELHPKGAKKLADELARQLG
ncbi:alpha/beta fold hydrolase [Ketobacter sp.]|uniref:alpha/beta fold hydrolase n=1 Tax=Ketobacter sp. TaxID=2083498 RepID=UPI0025C63D1D|nr:alpha/beta hydrolase [Ketobacter sp.]